VATSKISHDNEKLESVLLVAASHIVHTVRIQLRTVTFLAQAKKEWPVSRWWTTAIQQRAVKSYKNYIHTSESVIITQLLKNLMQNFLEAITFIPVTCFAACAGCK